MDYIGDLDYLELINLLSSSFEEVNGIEFYKDLFPDNQESNESNEFYKSNSIFLYTEKDSSLRKLKRRIMLKDTWSYDYKKYIENNEFALCSGLSYRGRVNRLENAQNLHALIIDLDSVGINELNNLITRMNKPPAFRTLPQATYIVVSGSGLHVYYFLDKPIELYPNIKLQMKALKYDLTFRTWDYKGTSKEKIIQYQSISQGYRMVGSINNKYNVKVRAFKTGDKVSLDTLNAYVNNEENKVNLDEKFKPSKYTREEAKELFPEWYNRVIINNNKKPKQWNIKPDLYYWWLRQIDKVKGGHRYYFLMCMSIYAVKCNIPKKQLKKDMENIFDSIAAIEHSNKLTDEDMISALEAYDRGYFNFTIDDIVKLSDIAIKKNKRNYQKQIHHLEEARAVRDVRMRRINRNWYDGGGRPKGSGTKEIQVLEAIKNHPDLNVTELANLLNISRTTIYKYKNKENKK